MKSIVISIDESNAIDRGLTALREGKIIAFPTDTVYGVAASAFDPQGIEKLFELKERAIEKAIAVLIGEETQIFELSSSLPVYAHRLAQRFWPGALTLILPALPNLPANLSPDPTIGIRMPDHTFIRNLIQKAGPLATTSANLSGMPNSLTAQDVIEQLGGKIDLVFDGGKTPGTIPSTVVDCIGDKARILREGMLRYEDLLEVIGDHLEKRTN